MRSLLLLFSVMWLIAWPNVSDAGGRLSCAASADGFTWGGRLRTYRIVASPRFTRERRPLLVVLHGGDMNARQIENVTGFSPLALREGFVVVYPQGIDNHWNDGRGAAPYEAHREQVDDVGFIDALITRLIAERGIDPRRVYVTGASNGGMMAFRLGCELHHRLAGIAPVIASMPADMASACRPDAPLPVVMIDGTADTLVPYEGGPIIVRKEPAGQVIAVEESAALFAAANHCESSPQSELLFDRAPRDGTTVELLTYDQCTAGATVKLFKIHGGGHRWPGTRRLSLASRVLGAFFGVRSRSIDASSLIWRELRKFSQPGEQ